MLFRVARFGRGCLGVWVLGLGAATTSGEVRVTVDVWRLAGQGALKCRVTGGRGKDRYSVKRTDRKQPESAA